MHGIAILIPSFLVADSQGNGDFMVVCLYVDDMIYMSSSESLIDDFKSCMMRNFEMTKLGLLQ